MFRHTPAAVPARPQLPSDLPRVRIVCSEPECDEKVAVRCSYVDNHMRGCGGAWCEEHRQMAYSALFCHRHAAIIQTLGTQYPTLTIYARP